MLNWKFVSGPADFRGSALLLKVKYEGWETAGGWMNGTIAWGPCLIIYNYTGLAFGWIQAHLNKEAGLAGMQIGSKARGFQQCRTQLCYSDRMYKSEWKGCMIAVAILLIRLNSWFISAIICFHLNKALLGVWSHFTISKVNPYQKAP